MATRIEDWVTGEVWYVSTERRFVQLTLELIEKKHDYSVQSGIRPLLVSELQCSVKETVS